MEVEQDVRSFQKLQVRPWDFHVMVLNSIGRTSDVALTVALARLLAVFDTESSLKFDEREVQASAEGSARTEGKWRHRCCSARSRIEPSPLMEAKVVWQVATCAADSLCPGIKGLRKSNPAFRISSQLSAAAAYIGNLSLLALHFPATWKLDPVAAMMGAIAGKQVHVLRWLFDGDQERRALLAEGVLSQPQPTYILKTLRKLPSDLASAVGGTTLRLCFGYGFPIDAQYFVPSRTGGFFEAASPLRAAASRGDVTGLRAWIERGAFVIRDTVHSSALLLAMTARDYRRLCTLLLDAGADPDVCFNGRTVFDALIEFADYERLQWWAATVGERRNLPLPIEIPYSNWEQLSRLSVKNRGFFRQLMSHDVVRFPYTGTHANKSLLYWVVQSSTNRMRLGQPVPTSAEVGRLTSARLFQTYNDTLHPFLGWYVGSGLPLDAGQPERRNADGSLRLDLHDYGEIFSPESAICCCLEYGHSYRYTTAEMQQCLSWYLALGARINAVHEYAGVTCLHVWGRAAIGDSTSTRQRALDVVRFLLQRGADPNVLTRDHRLPPVAFALNPLVMLELLVHPSFNYKLLPSVRAFLGSPEQPPLPFSAYVFFVLDDTLLSEQQKAKALFFLRAKYASDDEMPRPDPSIGGTALLLEVLKDFRREEAQGYGMSFLTLLRYCSRIETLLRLGADPNYVDHTSETVPTSVLTLLMDLCQRTLYEDRFQLKNAAERLAFLLQAFFLSKGIVTPFTADTINGLRVSDQGDTLLHAVCGIVPPVYLSKEFPEEIAMKALITTIIQVGASVGITNDTGNTPLHLLRLRTKPILEAFIEAATGTFRRKPDPAEEEGEEEVNRDREDGAGHLDGSQVGNRNNQKGNFRLVRSLLRARNKRGQTPMLCWVSCSVAMEYPTFASRLFPLLLFSKELDEGALHLADFDGQTVGREVLLNVQWGSAEQFEQGLRMLASLGLLDDSLWTDRATPNGFTVLHQAIVLKRTDLVRFLLPPYGKCDPTALDRNGQSAFWYPSAHSDPDVIQLLLFARDLREME